MCKNVDCWGSMLNLNSAFPAECLTLSVPAPLLRETIINKFLWTCAATDGPPASGNACGNEQAGAKSCANGEYCQPWNPSQYQCRRLYSYCGTQLTGVDFYGDDLAKYQLRLPEECCAKCATTVGCKGYTFVNYNADGKAYCYLKTGVGQVTAKAGGVSALMRY